MTETTPIYLVNPETKQVVYSFKNKQELRRKTGISASSIYRRIGKSLDAQKPCIIAAETYKGEYLITEKVSVMVPADPNAEYIVTDGERVYHKGSLEECKNMKHQIGFTTLQIKLWQQY